jgi:hypothetical protein
MKNVTYKLYLRINFDIINFVTEPNYPLQETESINHD